MIPIKGPVCIFFHHDTDFDIRLLPICYNITDPVIDVFNSIDDKGKLKTSWQRQT